MRIDSSVVMTPIFEERLDAEIVKLSQDGYVLTHLECIADTLYGYPSDLRWFGHCEPIYSLPLSSTNDGEYSDWPKRVDPFYAAIDGNASNADMNRIRLHQRMVLDSDRNPIIAIRKDLMNEEQKSLSKIWDYWRDEFLPYE